MSRQMQTSVSSVVAQHVKDKCPTVNVLAYSLAGQGLARVTVEVVHNQHSRENHSLVSESLSRAFDNRLTAVTGSFKSIDKAPYTERLSGVVRVNTQAVSLEAARGFRSVSTNIFMDEEDRMWVLRKTDAGDILVKSTGIEDHDSLRGLLNVVCSTGHSISSASRRLDEQVKQMQKSVVGGDYVQYVSAHGTETKFGYVVASAEDGKLIVLPSDKSVEEGEVVDPEAIVAKEDVSDAPETELSEQERMDQAVSVSRGVVGLSTLLDYYKKVFARSDAYYQEFAKRVQAHSFM